MPETQVTHTYLHDMTGKQRARIFGALDAAGIPFKWDQDFRRLIVPTADTDTLVSIMRGLA